MTQQTPGDGPKTCDLVAFIDAGVSWLRHTNLAGELDWLLLHGATATELAAVRPSWFDHVRHLRSEHRLIVQEGPAGFFRIVGALRGDPPPGDPPPVDAPDEDVNPELPAGGALAEAPMPIRIAHSARSLAALHGVGELKNPLNRETVGMFIRKASECNHWHNTTDYRSRAAAEAIAAEGQLTVPGYQAFCSRTLRHEHMVPNAVLYRMIMAEENPTEESIKALFLRFSKRATITRTEDASLRSSDMPPQFFLQGHAWYLNPLARYLEAGLVDSLEPRPGARWLPYE